MTIEIYKSALCPRCTFAINLVKKLQSETDDIKIITYDIFTDIKAFKDSNIKLIPTLKINNNQKSWILPKSDDIKSFISENR